MQHFIIIQYCYDYLINQIPVSLLLYSHIPAALIALLFGFFVLIKNKNSVGSYLFIVCLFFAISGFLDLGAWFSFAGASTTMFTWSLLGLVSLIFFLFSYFFLYTYITKKELPIWQKVLGFAILLPTVFWTFSGATLTAFDLNTCEAWENTLTNNYLFVAEGIITLATILLVVVQHKKAKDKESKKEIKLAGIGVIIFLLFFLISTLLVSFLVNDTLINYAYNLEIYGLFGMPILLGFLTYLVVRYHAFNIKLIGAQALVVALLVLTGSQFLFIQGSAARILNVITVVLALVFGHFLVRGVKREIEQKEKLAILSAQLEESNEKLKALDKLKTEFVSLVSHQIRSPLTAIKGYASMLTEGSYGKLAEDQDTAVKRVYTAAQELSNMVEDFLNITKIEQGGMKFEFMSVELGAVVKTLADEMQIPAQSKGLELKVSIPEGEQFNVTADPTKIKQVFLNLVDNSIKYTQQGFVEVSLKKEGKAVLFMVKDSGIGMNAETKAKLFQKFARGSEGGKVNTGGSGLGLYLAQQIARAHKGDITADSEGLGKGTTFTVTIPAN